MSPPALPLVPTRRSRSPRRLGLIVLLLAAGLLVGGTGGPDRGRAAIPAQLALEDSLARANQLYEERRYRAARDLYRRLLERPETPGTLLGPLHFNLGTAHARLGDVGAAILHLERARRHLGEVPEVTRNLNVVRARIEAPVAELPRPFWSRWAGTVVETTGPRGLFYGGLAAYLFGLVLAGLSMAGVYVERRTLRRLAATALIAAVLGTGGGLWSSYERASERSAVVLTESAPLRSAPDAEIQVERRISEGVLLEVRAEERTWIQVRLPDGRSGWLRAEDVGVI